MDSLFEYLFNFGLGAVFAGIMFMMYRDARNTMRQDREFMEERLTQIIDAYNASCNAMTTALNELTIWLKAKNGHRS